MESRASECHVDEGIRCNHEDEDFGGTGYVVVDEASPRRLVHICVYFSIEPFQEKAFEHVEADSKVDYEDDADYQGAERGQNGDGLERHMHNVRAFQYVDGGGHVGLETFDWHRHVAD